MGKDPYIGFVDKLPTTALFTNQPNSFWLGERRGFRDTLLSKG